MLIQHLGRRQVEILLRHMHPPLPQRIHPRLRAHPFQLRAAAPVHLFRNLGEVDAAREVHAARVDSQNVRARLDRRRGELDLAIDATGAQQRRVEDIEAIRGHDDFDVLGGFEAVELVEELEHGALDLGVATGATLNARGADGVDFVHEDDRGGVFAGHDEKLADHAGAFADVFLDQLGAADADEFGLGVVGNGAGEERFAGAGGAVEEDAFWLGDAEGFEEFGVFKAEFDDFFYFFDLLVEAADGVVGAVGDFFYHHERDQGVDGGGEEFFEFVAVGEEGYAFADGEFRDVDRVRYVDD